jgi:hypothetical protein
VAVVTEKFANNAQSTLQAAVASGDTSLSVASASAFPSSGNFRVIIDGEILLVTAVSGSTFTVSRGQEGTTAAAHAVGAYVTHVLTAASLANCPRSMTAKGDIEYLDGSGNVVRLAAGSNGQVLTLSGGVPSWAAAGGTPGGGNTQVQFNNSGGFGGSSAITLSATQLGFFGVSLVGQQSTTGTVTGFTAGAGTAVNQTSTFTGGTGSKAYTIGDIVLALKNLGLLQS